jgi:predicted CoA-substrate-specific enzyme activase
MKPSIIRYRFPYNLTEALENEKNNQDKHAGSDPEKNGDSLNHGINENHPQSGQHLSKSALSLYKNDIIKKSYFKLGNDDYSKWVGFVLDSIEGLDVKFIEVTAEHLMFDADGETIRLKVDFGRTNLVITLERENPQNGGIIDAQIKKIDKLINEKGMAAYKYVSDNGRTLAYINEKTGFSGDMKGYIGVDVGSVSTNVVFVDDNQRVIETVYTYTRGRVLDAIKTGLKELMNKLPSNANVMGVGVTGSSGELAKSILNADVYKTEIYSHAAATIHQIPNVKTILEIGGQDSKVIYVNNGIPEKSKMNEWCGAGTGAMLDAQANRLGISIKEFSDLAVKAKKSIDFRTRCGVFMDSCMIDAQAKGYPIEVIIRGLCNACAHNFISTLGINRKSIEQPIAFQGGVSANKGVKKELEDYISEARGEKVNLIVPLYHDVMGAIGMALIVGKLHKKTGKPTSFRGIDEIERITSEVNECGMADCPKNLAMERRCDLVRLQIGGNTIAAIGACEEFNRDSQSPNNIVKDEIKEERASELNKYQPSVN